MQIETIDPAGDASWEAFLLRAPEASVFHTGAWAAVLRETYGFRARYLVARRDGEIVAGVPLFEVNGGRLVGIPFSDLCPPLLPADGDGEALLEAATALAGPSHPLELRGDAPLGLAAHGFRRGELFYQHLVPLDAEIEELEARWHPSARRAIRKAERAGVLVRESTRIEDMRAFYRLHSLTRKKHGLIPQPWKFIERIHRHHIEGGPGCLLLAEHEGEIVAADVLLGFKDTLVYKFNASDQRALDLRPNNLLLRRAIALGVEQGYRRLDLGRCDADAEGLRRFKLLWAPEERPLHYFYYPARPVNGAVPTADSVQRRLLALFVRHAPLWALRGAGAALYRNFA